MELTGTRTIAADRQCIWMHMNDLETLSVVIPPESDRISGAGNGGIAGFAKGHADVGWTEVPGGTQLDCATHAAVGGKLADPFCDAFQAHVEAALSVDGRVG
jgi:hypothetical protein